MTQTLMPCMMHCYRIIYHKFYVCDMNCIKIKQVSIWKASVLKNVEASVPPFFIDLPLHPCNPLKNTYFHNKNQGLSMRDNSMNHSLPHSQIFEHTRPFAINKSQFAIGYNEV